MQRVVHVLGSEEQEWFASGLMSLVMQGEVMRHTEFLCAISKHRVGDLTMPEEAVEFHVKKHARDNEGR